MKSGELYKNVWQSVRIYRDILSQEVIGYVDTGSVFLLLELPPEYQAYPDFFAKIMCKEQVGWIHYDRVFCEKIST